MTWTRIDFAPGVRKDDSPLAAQGSYIDADKIRFVNGLPETIYGWEKASPTSLTGICRGAHSWQDNSRNAWAAFGTHLGLYGMDLDGAVTEITPVTAYGTPTFDVTVTDGSATVILSGWTHGLVVGQSFKIDQAAPGVVGGIPLNGLNTVRAVTSADALTFDATIAATASEGPTTVSCLSTTYLAPGQADGLAGAGFGTGGYGSDGYGGSSDGLTLFPRTWAFDQWGQNLLGNPRGGGLYEWTPTTQSADLIANGTFSTGASWLAGTGWSVGGGFATASAGASATLEQNILLQPGAWHLLTLNLSVGAGALVPIVGASTIGPAITATGNTRRAFYAGGGVTALQFLKDSSFTGALHDVGVRMLTTAQQVPNAPTQIGSMFVTAERIVVTCGSNLEGAFDPLQVDWSEAEDHQTWTPTSANLAGGYTLPGGGRIVRGLPGARENVIWTVEALWSMRYTTNPNSVYEFIEMGRGCGLIGPNAATQVGGVWYWMTPAGAFYAYGGGAPAMLPCTVARDLRDHLAWVQQDKVYAARVVGKNHAEIWWFYPDIRDGNECSRYVVYDTRGGTWSCGTFDRSAYMDGTVFEFPLAVDLDGQIWFHEKGFTADGGPRGWFLKSAFNNNPNGQIVVNGVRPDTDDLQGGYSIAFTSKTRSARGVTSRAYAPVNISATTGDKAVRVKGEQVAFTIAATAAPSFWRQGQLQMDLVPNSARR